MCPEYYVTQETSIDTTETGNQSSAHIACSHVTTNKNDVTRNSGVPRNFVAGGGGSINSVVDRGRRERGSGGGSPLVRISGGGCNLVQKFHFI